MNTFMKTVILAAGGFAMIAGCEGPAPAPESQGGQPSLAQTPEQKAAMELGSAQTLEKSRKTKEAGEAYRRIIDEYPDSPQAKIAAERLESLGTKAKSR